MDVVELGYAAWWRLDLDVEVVMVVELMEVELVSLQQASVRPVTVSSRWRGGGEGEQGEEEHSSPNQSPSSSSEVSGLPG